METWKDVIKLISHNRVEGRVKMDIIVLTKQTIDNQIILNH